MTGVEHPSVHKEVKILDKHLLDQLGVGNGQRGNEPSVDAVHFAVQAAPEVLNGDRVVEGLLELVTKGENGPRAGDASTRPEAVLALDVAKGEGGDEEVQMKLSFLTKLKSKK